LKIKRQKLMEKPTICVIGMGYIGLPTSIIFANQGFTVRGCDVKKEIVGAINDCKPIIEEPELEERLKMAVQSGNLHAFDKPTPSDIYIIAVPTPVNHVTNEADLRFVESATRSILPYLKKNNLVILESTVPPGTTRDLVKRIILEAGLFADNDIQVAHAPEKAIPGKLFYELEHNDRIVGGVDAGSTESAYQLYLHMTKGQLSKTDATTAEMVKLVENTYRDVNIALANEFAMLAERLDLNIWNVIEYANHHPRVNVHSPGPGVGGHCIAVDPWFLVGAAPDLMKLVRSAREINDNMPKYTANRVKTIIKDRNIVNPKVTVLGLTYKANVDDIRESPSLEICDLLAKEGIDVLAHDACVTRNLVKGQCQSIEEVVKDSDLMLILVAHDQYKNINPSSIAHLMRHPILMDTKNCIDCEAYKKAGFETHLLGGN
jgi:UDP-N-acetyl-D-mannosaminuronic acid dehydrogenase